MVTIKAEHGVRALGISKQVGEARPATTVSGHFDYTYQPRAPRRKNSN